MRDEPSLARRIVPPLAVAALTLAVFFPARNAGITNLDDVNTLVSNRAIHAWTWANLKLMWTSFDLISWGGVYQPVAWMTHAFDYWYWGDRYIGHHLTSLLIQAANAALAYLFLQMLLRRAWPQERTGAIGAAAVLGAIAWAINPVRVQVVGWLAVRGYLVATFFGLLSLIAYLKAQESDKAAPAARRWGWLAASVSFYLLSLFSKSIALTLPLTFLVVDAWPLGRLSGKGRLRQALGLLAEKIPFFVAGLVLFEISLIGRRHWNPGLPFSLGSMTSKESLSQVIFECSYFLEKTLLPVHVIGINEHRPPLDPLDYFFAFRALVLVALTLAAIAARKRWPAGLACWLCYLITLAPLSGLVRYDLGEQISQDKYGYLAALWLGVGAGFAALSLLRAAGRSQWRVWVTRALLALFAAGLCGATFAQSGLWGDQERYWTYVMDVQPDCLLCRIVLGIDWRARPDRLFDAVRLMTQVADLWPEFASNDPNVAATIAAAIPAMPEPERSRALDLVRHAFWEDPKHPELHHALAVWHDSQGRLDDAIDQMSLAVKYAPADGRQRFELAQLYEKKGRRSDAAREMDLAVKDAGGDSRLHFDIGLYLGNQGAVDRAIPQMLLALKSDPVLWPAHFDLGIYYGGQKKYALAAEHTRAALKLDPKNPQAHYNLGFFFLQLGHPEEARREFQKALALDPTATNTRQNLSYVEGLLSRRAKR